MLRKMSRTFAVVLSLLLILSSAPTNVTLGLAKSQTITIKTQVKSSTSINLSWTKVLGATTYAIYRATSKAGTPSHIADTKATSYTNTGLTKGKTYFYKIRPFHLSGKTKIYNNYSSVKVVKLVFVVSTPKPTLIPTPSPIQILNKINVILLIGDGMGENHITATRVIYKAKGQDLAIDTIKDKGFLSTNAVDESVTDSAAAATALSSGYRTYNGVLGIDKNGNRVQTILEKALSCGYRTGIVSTKFISDATPAAFVSHVGARSDSSDITKQMLNLMPNVILGGGLNYFNSILLNQSVSKGYKFVRNAAAMDAATGDYLLGLFQPENMEDPTAAPTLSEMTKKALSVLSKDNSNFFVMIEGGLIDTRSHSNDLLGMTAQLKAFDDAVAASLEFAREHTNTIVIVTADHETGGLKLPSNPTVENLNNSCYTSVNHTAVDVPLYVFGKDASSILSATKNYQLPVKIAKLFGFTDFPKVIKTIKKAA